MSQGVAAVAPKIADAVGNQLEARGIDLNSIKQEAEQILRQTGKRSFSPTILKLKPSRLRIPPKQEWPMQLAIRPRLRRM